MPRQHTLINVQKLPVLLDRRVGLEYQALRESHYAVSVLCPMGSSDPRYEVLDDVHLDKYRPAPPESGALGYHVGFVYCWLRTAVLSIASTAGIRLPSSKAATQRTHTGHSACNPPDTYWALAPLWRWVTGGRATFMFDHPDLNPEVCVSRFGETDGRGRPLQPGVLRWSERQAFQTAAHMISTNESCRRVAVGQGRVEPCRTTIVRSGPDVARISAMAGRRVTELVHLRIVLTMELIRRADMNLLFPVRRSGGACRRVGEIHRHGAELIKCTGTQAAQLRRTVTVHVG